MGVGLEERLLNRGRGVDKRPRGSMVTTARHIAPSTSPTGMKTWMVSGRSDSPAKEGAFAPDVMSEPVREPLLATDGLSLAYRMGDADCWVGGAGSTTGRG